jgi:hypothetical protein
MIFFAQACNQRIQLGVDAAHRGRVMALWVLVFMGTTPIGSLLIGWLSERYGPRTGVWLGGVVSFLAGASVLTYQLRRSGDRLGMQLRPYPRVYVVEEIEEPTASQVPVRV